MEETLEQQPTQQQAEQLTTVPTAEAPARKTAKEVLKDYFTATRIAYIAIFTALSFAIRFLQFAILPAVSYEGAIWYLQRSTRQEVFKPVSAPSRAWLRLF